MLINRIILEAPRFQANVAAAGSGLKIPVSFLGEFLANECRIEPNPNRIRFLLNAFKQELSRAVGLRVVVVRRRRSILVFGLNEPVLKVNVAGEYVAGHSDAAHRVRECASAYVGLILSNPGKFMFNSRSGLPILKITHGELQHAVAKCLDSETSPPPYIRIFLNSLANALMERGYAVRIEHSSNTLRVYAVPLTLTVDVAMTEAGG
jgi:hypothetical protein